MSLSRPRLLIPLVLSFILATCASGCEPLHRDIDSLDATDTGPDTSPSDAGTGVDDIFAHDADTNLIAPDTASADTDDSDSPPLCSIDNGGCGNPVHFECLEGDDSGLDCQPLDLCATDNGGCGDERFAECTDGLGQDPSCVAIKYHPTTTEDSWGTSQECSLRAAIESINNSEPVDGCHQGQVDTIVLSSGQTYNLDRSGPDGVDNGSADLWIDSAITITSDGEAPAVIDAGEASRALYISKNGLLTIDGVLITGGVADPGNGGAILNRGTLHIHHSKISNNRANGSDGQLEGGGFGGGIYNEGHLTMVHAILEQNIARGGRGQDQLSGQASAGGGGAGLGGGVFNSGTLDLTATVFSDNQAIGGRGGNPTSCSSNPSGTAGNGGGHGGDGGSGSGDDGGPGDFGGGGGGGTGNNPATSPGAGGDGGFGGGGGGAGPHRFGDDHLAGGDGGFGAGDGGVAIDSCPAAGGGGAGIGGAIFHKGIELHVDDASHFASNIVTEGQGGDPYHPGSQGQDGQGIAPHVFHFDGAVDCVSDCSDIVFEH